MIRGHIKISRRGKTSIDDLIRALDESARAAKAAEALDGVTNFITEEIRQTIPVDTGALAESGTWTSETDAYSYRSEISFGGESADHSIYVLNRGREGDFPWDNVIPRYEERIEELLNDQFPG